MVHAWKWQLTVVHVTIDEHNFVSVSNHSDFRSEWWLRVVKRTFINAGVQDSPVLNTLAWHLIKLYSTTQGWEVIPGKFTFQSSQCYIFILLLISIGVTDVLHKLKDNGQRMGVISNIDPRIDNILKEAALRHYFEFVLPSYEPNCFKPDPQIFN